MLNWAVQDVRNHVFMLPCNETAALKRKLEKAERELEKAEREETDPEEKQKLEEEKQKVKAEFDRRFGTEAARLRTEAAERERRDLFYRRIFSDPKYVTKLQAGP